MHRTIPVSILITILLVLQVSRVYTATARYWPGTWNGLLGWGPALKQEDPDTQGFDVISPTAMAEETNRQVPIVEAQPNTKSTNLLNYFLGVPSAQPSQLFEPLNNKMNPSLNLALPVPAQNMGEGFLQNEARNLNPSLSEGLAQNVGENLSPNLVEGLHPKLDVGPSSNIIGGSFNPPNLGESIVQNEAKSLNPESLAQQVGESLNANLVEELNRNIRSEKSNPSLDEVVQNFLTGGLGPNSIGEPVLMQTAYEQIASPNFK